MTLQEFLNKYLGKTKGYPDDSQYLGQCLSIVKLYIKECFGINPPPSGTNSAYGYWSNFPNPLGEVFDKVENTPDLIPQEGWIAIWKPWTSNIYGHIAIVASGSTTGTLKNYAQNWTSKVFQLESNRYTNVVGFLKPIKVLEEDMITDEQKRILDFIGDRSEGDVREAFGYLADKKKHDEQILGLTNRVRDLEMEIVEINKTVDSLRQHYMEKEKEAISYQKKLDSANTKVSELLLTNEELDRKAKDNWNLYDKKCKELNETKQQLEEALKTPVTDLNGWQLFTLLIKKIGGFNG
jgi:hypothetical protein